MSIVESLSKNKWVSLFIFFLIDLMMIASVSILSLDETTDLIVGLDFSRNDPVVSISLFFGICIAQFVLIYYLTLQMLEKSEMVQLYPQYDEDTKLDCRYSRDEILKWTQELAKTSNVTVNRVYLMKSPLPNAFTFSLPLVGSVVVLHSNVLDFLEGDEVRAIIAHELAHIKNRDSFVSIFTRMPSFFMDVVYLYIYVRIFLGAASSLVVGLFAQAAVRFIVLLVFFGISRLAMFIARFFVQNASRKAELLADIHAGKVISPLTTVNALIRLGQRVEAISALLDEVKWLESLNPERSSPLSMQELTRMMSSYPLDGIDEANARNRAPWIFLSAKLRHLRDVYGVVITDEQIEAIAKPAVANLLKKRKLEDPKKDESKGKTVDWRESDYDGDRRLSETELRDLINVLRESPTKFLFNSEVGMNIMMMDHPDFRRRVLSLADVFEL